MLTLVERIEWILENRAEKEDGRPNQRAFSRAAGLEETHIGKILKRLHKKPTGDLEGRTLAAIAHAGGVSLEWLVTGAGEPVTALPRPLSPLNEARRRRALAGALALEAGRPESAVKRTLGLPIDPADYEQPTLWWVEQIDDEVNLLRQGEAELRPMERVPRHPKELPRVSREPPPSEPTRTPPTQTGTVRRKDVEAQGRKPTKS